MSQPKVAILDYGCGNLGSVANAVRKVGGEAWIGDLGKVDWMDGFQVVTPTHLILPGQGAFCALEPDLISQLIYWRERIPVLGICLGMQLMCQGSEEAPGVPGLGWLPYQ